MAEPSLASMEAFEREIFRIRLELGLVDALRVLAEFYGARADFASCVERFLDDAVRAYAQRPREPRLLDLRRTSLPDWFQQSNMVGYVCYVDRFRRNAPRNR